MLNAATAHSISSVWQSLEATHGIRATEFMWTILGQAIEAAAKAGQNSISHQGVSSEFLPQLIQALQALGYGTQLNGDTLTVT